MSTIKAVGLGIVLVLVLALGVQSYLVHRLNTKLAQTSEQLKQANLNVKEVNKAISTQVAVAKVTDLAVKTSIERITANTNKGTAIKAVVDNVTKRVANENLSNTVASAAYVNSMWDAYCTADKGNSDCASRQPVD